MQEKYENRKYASKYYVKPIFSSAKIITFIWFAPSYELSHPILGTIFPPVSYPVEAVQSIRAVEAVLERDDEDGIRVVTCHVTPSRYKHKMNNRERENGKRPCESERMHHFAFQFQHVRECDWTWTEIIAGVFTQLLENQYFRYNTKGVDKNLGIWTTFIKKPSL